MASSEMADLTVLSLSTIRSKLTDFVSNNNSFSSNKYEDRLYAFGVIERATQISKYSEVAR